MDHAVINTVLIGASSMLVLGLSAVAWFFVKRGVEHMDRLTDQMSKLERTMASLSTTFVTQEQHNRDMEELRIAQFASQNWNRRATDRCTQEVCPLKGGA